MYMYLASTYMFRIVCDLVNMYRHVCTMCSDKHTVLPAPGKSADSFCISKGMVLVSPSGTRGRHPSMEDTGLTYNTCDCSLYNGGLKLIYPCCNRKVSKYAKYAVYV